MTTRGFYHVTFSITSESHAGTGTFLIEADVPQTMEMAMRLKDACKAEATSMFRTNPNANPDAEIQITHISRLGP